MDNDLGNTSLNNNFGRNANDRFGKDDFMAGKSSGFGDKSISGRSSLSSIYAQARQNIAARNTINENKTGQIKKDQSPSISKRTTFVGPTSNAERADRIAKRMFPELAKIAPGSLGNMERSKKTFSRVFKKPDAYVPIRVVKGWGQAAQKGDRAALNKAGFNAAEIMKNDKTKKEFIRITKDITG